MFVILNAVLYLNTQTKDSLIFREIPAFDFVYCILRTPCGFVLPLLIIIS